MNKIIFRIQELIGKVLFKLGFKPTFSTGIHDGLTCGYGDLSTNGFFQYPVYEEDYNKLLNRES